MRIPMRTATAHPGHQCVIGADELVVPRNLCCDMRSTANAVPCLALAGSWLAHEMPVISIFMRFECPFSVILLGAQRTGYHRASASWEEFAVSSRAARVNQRLPVASAMVHISLVSFRLLHRRYPHSVRIQGYNVPIVPALFLLLLDHLSPSLPNVTQGVHGR